MRYIWIIIFMGLTLTCRAVIVDSIVANVGKYSISKYDLQRMGEFLQISKSTNNAFIELLSSYALFTAVETDPEIIYRNNEVDNFITSLTNSTNSNDPSFKMRQQLFHDYPGEYTIEIKRNTMTRSLGFYKTNFKAMSDQPIPDNELKDFYAKNKKYFTDPPKLDMIVVSLPQPPEADLDTLAKIENILTAITNSLYRTDDINPVLDKYRKIINFEPYSGRTGLKDVYEIFRSGCPEELINIALMKSIPQRSSPPIIVKNGTIIGYEKYIFKNSPNKVHYFIVKLISRKMEQQSTFEEAKPSIINLLKDEKLLSLIQKYVTDKIIRGEIPVDIVDKSYEGVYDEYLRR